MADLSTLMQLPGAIAAFSYTDAGELTAHQVAADAPLDEKVLDLLAHMCVANISIATMQARGWETVTGQGGFYPINGFTIMGMDWSAVVNGQSGVVLKNGDADYQAAYNALG